MEGGTPDGGPPSTPAAQQQQQQVEGALLQSLSTVLAGIQANQERSYTGRGLVTAQHTAADYERVVEQGQLAVQAQLHFTYPQTQTVLDKSWSRLSMSPASRKQQPAEQLPGVCAEDEPTARKQSKARSLFDRFSPSSSPKSSPAAPQQVRSAEKPVKSPTRSRSPLKQTSSVEIAFGRRWPENSSKKPGSSSSTPASKRVSTADGAEVSPARLSNTSQEERISTIDRIKRFISPKKSRSTSMEQARSEHSTPQRSSYDNAAAAAMAAAASPASATSAAAAAVAALEELQLPELPVSPRDMSPTRQPQPQPEECDSPLLGHPLFKQQLLRHNDSPQLLEQALSAPAAQLSAAAAAAGLSQQEQTELLQAALLQPPLEPLTLQRQLLACSFPSAQALQEDGGPQLGAAQQPAGHCDGSPGRQQDAAQLTETPAGSSRLLRASACDDPHQLTTPAQGTPYFDCSDESPARHSTGRPRSSDANRALLMASCPANFFTRNGIGRSPSSSMAGIYQSPPPAATVAAAVAASAAAALGIEGDFAGSAINLVAGSSPGMHSVYFTPTTASGRNTTDGSAEKGRTASPGDDDDVSCSDLSTCDPEVEHYSQQAAAPPAYEQPYGLPAVWEGSTVQADQHSSSTVVNWDSLTAGPNSAASSTPSSPRITGFKPLTTSTAGSASAGGSSSAAAEQLHGDAHTPPSVPCAAEAFTSLAGNVSGEGVQGGSCARDAGATAAMPAAATSTCGSFSASRANSRPWALDVNLDDALSPSALSRASSVRTADSPSVDAARKLLAAKEAVAAAAAGALQAMRHSRSSAAVSPAGSTRSTRPSSPTRECSTHSAILDAVTSAGEATSPASRALQYSPVSRSKREGPAAPGTGTQQLEQGMVASFSAAEGPTAAESGNTTRAPLGQTVLVPTSAAVGADELQWEGPNPMLSHQPPQPLEADTVLVVRPTAAGDEKRGLGQGSDEDLDYTDPGFAHNEQLISTTMESQGPYQPVSLAGVHIRLLQLGSDEDVSTEATHDSISLGLPPVSLAGSRNSRSSTPRQSRVSLALDLGSSASRSSTLQEQVLQSHLPGQQLQQHGSDAGLSAGEGVQLQADRSTLDLPDGLSSLGSETISRDFSRGDSALQHSILAGSAGSMNAAGWPHSRSSSMGLAAGAALRLQDTHRPSLDLLGAAGGSGSFSSTEDSLRDLEQREQHPVSPSRLSSSLARHAAAAGPQPATEASAADVVEPQLVLPGVPHLAHDGATGEAGGRAETERAAATAMAPANAAAGMVMAAADSMLRSAKSPDRIASHAAAAAAAPDDAPMGPEDDLHTEQLLSEGCEDSQASTLDGGRSYAQLSTTAASDEVDTAELEAVLQPLQQQDMQYLQQLAHQEQQQLLGHMVLQHAAAEGSEECSEQLAAPQQRQQQQEEEDSLARLTTHEATNSSLLENMWAQACSLAGHADSASIAASGEEQHPAASQQPQQQNPAVAGDVAQEQPRRWDAAYQHGEGLNVSHQGVEDHQQGMLPAAGVWGYAECEPDLCHEQSPAAVAAGQLPLELQMHAAAEQQAAPLAPQVLEQLWQQWQAEKQQQQQQQPGQQQYGTEEPLDAFEAAAEPSLQLQQQQQQHQKDDKQHAAAAAAGATSLLQPAAQAAPGDDAVAGLSSPAGVQHGTCGPYHADAEVQQALAGNVPSSAVAAAAGSPADRMAGRSASADRAAEDAAEALLEREGQQAQKGWQQQSSILAEPVRVHGQDGHQQQQEEEEEEASPAAAEGPECPQAAAAVALEPADGAGSTDAHAAAAEPVQGEDREALPGSVGAEAWQSGSNSSSTSDSPAPLAELEAIDKAGAVQEAAAAAAAGGAAAASGLEDGATEVAAAPSIVQAGAAQSLVEPGLDVHPVMAEQHPEADADGNQAHAAAAACTAAEEPSGAAAADTQGQEGAPEGLHVRPPAGLSEGLDSNTPEPLDVQTTSHERTTAGRGAVPAALEELQVLQTGLQDSPAEEPTAAEAGVLLAPPADLATSPQTHACLEGIAAMFALSGSLLNDTVNSIVAPQQDEQQEAPIAAAGAGVEATATYAGMADAAPAPPAPPAAPAAAAVGEVEADATAMAATSAAALKAENNNPGADAAAAAAETVAAAAAETDGAAAVTAALWPPGTAAMAAAEAAGVALHAAAEGAQPVAEAGAEAAASNAEAVAESAQPCATVTVVAAAADLAGAVNTDVEAAVVAGHQPLAVESAAAGVEASLTAGNTAEAAKECLAPSTTDTTGVAAAAATADSEAADRPAQGGIAAATPDQSDIAAAVTMPAVEPPAGAAAAEEAAAAAAAVAAAVGCAASPEAAIAGATSSTSGMAAAELSTAAAGMDAAGIDAAAMHAAPSAGHSDSRLAGPTADGPDKACTAAVEDIGAPAAASTGADSPVAPAVVVSAASCGVSPGQGLELHGGSPARHTADAEAESGKAPTSSDGDSAAVPAFAGPAVTKPLVDHTACGSAPGMAAEDGATQAATAAEHAASELAAAAGVAGAGMVGATGTAAAAVCHQPSYASALQCSNRPAGPAADGGAGPAAVDTSTAGAAAESQAGAAGLQRSSTAADAAASASQVAANVSAAGSAAAPEDAPCEDGAANKTGSSTTAAAAADIAATAPVSDAAGQSEHDSSSAAAAPPLPPLPAASGSALSIEVPAIATTAPSSAASAAPSTGRGSKPRSYAAAAAAGSLNTSPACSAPSSPTRAQHHTQHGRKDKSTLVVQHSHTGGTEEPGSPAWAIKTVPDGPQSGSCSVAGSSSSRFSTAGGSSVGGSSSGSGSGISGSAAGTGAAVAGGAAGCSSSAAGGQQEYYHALLYGKFSSDGGSSLVGAGRAHAGSEPGPDSTRELLSIGGAAGVTGGVQDDVDMAGPSLLLAETFSGNAAEPAAEQQQQQQPVGGSSSKHLGAEGAEIAEVELQPAAAAAEPAAAAASIAGISSRHSSASGHAESEALSAAAPAGSIAGASSRRSSASSTGQSEALSAAAAAADDGKHAKRKKKQKRKAAQAAAQADAARAPTAAAAAMADAADAKAEAAEGRLKSSAAGAQWKQGAILVLLLVVALAGGAFLCIGPGAREGRPGRILQQSVSSSHSTESLSAHASQPPAPGGGRVSWWQQVPGTLAEGTTAAAVKPGQWLRQAQASSAAAAEKSQQWVVGLSGKIASRAAAYTLQLWQPVQTLTVATVAAVQEHVPWLQQRLQLWQGWKDLGAASNPPGHIPQQQQQPSAVQQQQLQHGHADIGGPAAMKPATSQQQQKQQQQQHEGDERREAQALVARELQQLLQQQQEQLAADDQEEAEAMRRSLQELQSRVQRMQECRAAAATASAATRPADTAAGQSQLQATPSAEHGTHHGHHHLEQQQQQEEVTGTAGAAGRQQQQHMAWSQQQQRGGGGAGGGDSLHLPASRLVDVLNDLLEANRLTLQAADHEEHGDMQELLQRFRADVQRWQQATAATAAAAATGDELQRTEGGDLELQGQPPQQQEQALTSPQQQQELEPQQEEELPSGQQVQHVVYTASSAADADAAGEDAERTPAPAPTPMLQEELQALAGALGLDKDPVRLQQILMGQHQDHLQLQRWPGPDDSDDYVVTVPYEVMVHDYDDYVVQMNQEREQPAAAAEEDRQGAQEQPAGDQQEVELEGRSAPAADASAAGEAEAVPLQQQQQQTPGSAELVEGGAEPEQQQVRPQQPAATGSTHTEQHESLPPGYYDYYADLHPPAPHEHQQQQGHKLWAGDAGSTGTSGAAVAETQQQQQQGQEQPWSQQQQEQYEAMDLYYDNEDQPWLPDSPANQQQQQQLWDEEDGAGSASDIAAAAADSTEQQQRHAEEAEGQQQGLNVAYDDVEQQLHTVKAAVEDPSLDAQQQPQQQRSQDVQQPTVDPGEGGEEHLLHAEGDAEEQQQQQEPEQEQGLSEEGVAPDALPGQWTDPEAAHREASAAAAGDDVDTAAAAGDADGLGTDADADALAQLLAAMQAAGTDAAAEDSSSSGEDASAAVEQPPSTAAASGDDHGSMPSLVQPGPTADSAQPWSDSDGQPEQQQATGSLLQGPSAGATGLATTAGAAGSKPGPRLTKGTAALAAAAAGVSVCALACLLVLVMSARQGAVAAMGPATPFPQQRRRQPDIDASEEADGGGYAWDSQGAGGYDHDGEIQPADGVYYDGVNGYGPGGGGAGLGGDDGGWSDEDDASFGPSDVSDIGDDDSQFSYDLSEGPLEDEEAGDEEEDGAAGRDSSFAGFAPIPGAAATAAAAAAAGASAAAAAVGAAGPYALRPRRGMNADSAVDFLWLRPNKFIPRRSQSNIGPDGVAGGSGGGASGGGITQRWLRNRVVTSIGGAAAQNPEVMDLVHSSAAVAYSSPPQPQQQQRRLSSGALMASPGQQQQAAAGQQYAERRPSSAGGRGDRSQPGGAAGGTPGGRGVPGLQLASVAAMLRGGGGYGSSPGRAGRAEGAVGMGQKSPRRLRDDRADVVLED